MATEGRSGRTNTGGRYALYYVPPRDSDLWAFGCAWLGRDPETGEEVTEDETPELPLRDFSEAIAAPRFYGFHATLRAPFTLADGAGEGDLIAVAEAVAAAHAPFDAPPLELGILGPYLALLLSEPCPPMDALAAAAVKACEPLRAPLSEADQARRRRANLTQRQIGYLDRWGYPYVFEEFIFHMTLTDKLQDEEERAVMEDTLENVVSYLGAGPLPVREIALFHQPDRETPFRVMKRIPLGRP